jgi:type IV pilus assembly protein PilE
LRWKIITGVLKKIGFTLLELLIVIIIVGVLATIGFTQYTAVVERSRGAEARRILGQLRSMCAAIYIPSQSGNQCTAENLTIGTIYNQIPSDCNRASHYFYYNSSPSTGSVTFNATRCEGSSGKQPGAPSGSNRYLQLTTNFTAGGTDNWTTNYGY